MSATTVAPAMSTKPNESAASRQRSKELRSIKSRKERRYEKECAALCERSTHILPKTTFRRLVVDETKKSAFTNVRYSQEAISALQTAAEQELTTVLKGAGICAALGGRETITVADMRNFQSLRSM